MREAETTMLNKPGFLAFFLMLASVLVSATTGNNVTGYTVSVNDTVAFNTSSYNLTFNTSYPNMNLSIINVTFPVGYTLTGATLQNLSINNVPNTSVAQVFGQVIQIRITSPRAANYSNSSVVINLTGIQNPLASGTYNIQVKTFETTANNTMNNVTNASVTIIAGPRVNITTYAYGLGGNNAANTSGSIFNVSAIGYDGYGNVNNTGGFNFSANFTNVAYFTGLGGNGTVYAIFNATTVGRVVVNVTNWLASFSNLFPNSTGVNLTVTTNNVTGLGVLFNNSVAGFNASYNFTFNTTPNSYNLTIINITFPAGYNVNNTALGNLSINTGLGPFPNSTAITKYAVGNKGLPVVSLNLTNRVGVTNVSNALVVINLTSVTNPTASAAYLLQVETFSDLGTAGTSATNVTATVIAGNLVGLNYSVAAGTNSNESGQIFNLSAVGFDVYGNVNNTGGFNWSANDTGVLTYFSGLGGNGSIYAIFNATHNGTARLNVTASYNISAWNSTGGPNLTVRAGPIFGINVSAVTGFNATNGSGSTFNLSAVAYDLNGNWNQTITDYKFYVSNPLVAEYSSGNNTPYGVFIGRRIGTAAVTVVNGSVSNSSITLTVNQSAGIYFVNVTMGAGTSTNTTGHIFNVSATGMDYGGNTNNSGGFNFTLNTSGIITNFSGLGGNGTVYAIFNISNWTTGQIKVNATSNRNTSGAFGGAVNSSLVLTALNGSAKNYTLTASTSAPTAGDTITVTVTALDTVGNVATSAAGTLAITSSAVSSFGIYINGVLGTTGTATLASGVATFTTKYKFSDPVTMTVTDTNSSTGTITVTWKYSATGTNTGSGSGSGSGSGYTPTATPAPTPTATPVPSNESAPAQGTQILDDHSTVAVSSGSSGSGGLPSTVFSLTYTATNAFKGTLEYELPFDCADYTQGLVVLTPKPASVKCGSVLAFWDVTLKAGETFNAQVQVLKAVPSNILASFKAPTATASTVAGPTGPTAKATATPAIVGAGSLTGQKPQPDNTWMWLILGIIVIAVAIYAYTRMQSSGGSGRRK